MSVEHAAGGQYAELAERLEVGDEQTEERADVGQHRGAGRTRRLAEGLLDGDDGLFAGAALLVVAIEQVDAVVDAEPEDDRADERGEDVQRADRHGCEAVGGRHRRYDRGEDQHHRRDPAEVERDVDEDQHERGDARELEIVGDHGLDVDALLVATRELDLEAGPVLALVDAVDDALDLAGDGLAKLEVGGEAGRLHQQRQHLAVGRDVILGVAFLLLVVTERETVLVLRLEVGEVERGRGRVVFEHRAGGAGDLPVAAPLDAIPHRLEIRLVEEIEAVVLEEVNRALVVDVADGGQAAQLGRDVLGEADQLLAVVSLGDDRHVADAAELRGDALDVFHAVEGARQELGDVGVEAEVGRQVAEREGDHHGECGGQGRPLEREGGQGGEELLDLPGGAGHALGAFFLGKDRIAAHA